VLFLLSTKGTGTMGSIVKIGCVLSALLWVPHQQGAAGADLQKANPQVNPPAASRAPDREVTDTKRAIPAASAAESRSLVPTAVLKERTPAAANAVGTLNHVERQATEARRAPLDAKRVGRTNLAPAENGAQRVAPESQTLQKQSMPSAAVRQRAAQPELKSDLAHRPADQARESGPQLVQRSPPDAGTVPAARMNRLDGSAVEARRRAPQSGPPVRAVPEGTQPDQRLPSTATTK
jgi:hypothetical protein